MSIKAACSKASEDAKTSIANYFNKLPKDAPLPISWES